jgi:PAS domain S-box-containing protein
MRAGRRFQHPIFRYSEAALFCGAALAAWFVIPALHPYPFMLFLTAVIFSTRFAGLGPGILAVCLSLIILDYIVLSPHFQFMFNTDTLIQLLVFVAISVLVGSLARQRSQADSRTERVQRELADIVESSQDAILTKDVNGIITSWNAGAERLYGYRADEVIGRHVSLLAPPEQPDEIPRIMATLMRGERVRHHITERIRKDGQRLTVFVSISALMGNRGQIVGASAISHDVSAQVRAEEALRKNEKLATAGRLAATIAHEINNPLEAIGNLLYLARKDKVKADEYLHMAELELTRVAKIAQQTLGFVREPASPVSFDLGTLLDEVLQLHGPALRGKKVDVCKEYASHVQVLGFPGELRQVFINLIANSIDAVPGGGQLRLRVERSRQWSHGHRPGARVTIADNGCGMTPETLTHLFEPFFTTKKESGTGLGLWLSYNIVQKHGGSIRVRSRTRAGLSGTLFSIFLPTQLEKSTAA